MRKPPASLDLLKGIDLYRCHDIEGRVENENLLPTSIWLCYIINETFVYTRKQTNKKTQQKWTSSDILIFQ